MAGKARRSREREARKKAKRARRETNAAHYAALRDSGKNSKSKRYARNSKRDAKHEKHQHREPMCGNAGCKKCFPRKDKPHVAARKLKIARAAIEATQKRQGIHPFPMVRPN